MSPREKERKEKELLRLNIINARISILVNFLEALIALATLFHLANS